MEEEKKEMLVTHSLFVSQKGKDIAAKSQDFLSSSRIVRAEQIRPFWIDYTRLVASPS